jgi:hypothetical protein
MAPASDDCMSSFRLPPEEAFWTVTLPPAPDTAETFRPFTLAPAPL